MSRKPFSAKSFRIIVDWILKVLRNCLLNPLRVEFMIARYGSLIARLFLGSWLHLRIHKTFKNLHILLNWNFHQWNCNNSDFGSCIVLLFRRLWIFDVVDFDIRISSGWSIVPLSDQSDLKVRLKMLFSKTKIIFRKSQNSHKMSTSPMWHVKSWHRTWSSIAV